MVDYPKEMFDEWDTIRDALLEMGREVEQLLEGEGEDWYIPPRPLCDYCKSRAGFKCQRAGSSEIIQLCGKCRMVFVHQHGLTTVGTYHVFD